MAVYFIDLINGDDANDGLTAALPKKDIFLLSGVSNLDTNTIWVRRGSYTFLEIKTINFAHIVFWPEEGQYMYNDRPAEGTAEGWDADVDESIFDIAGYRVTLTGSNAQLFTIANTKILADTTANVGLFYVNGGTFNIESCIIESGRTGVDTGSIFNIVYSGYVYFNFNNSNITISSAFCGMPTGEDMNRYWEINIDNCTIVSWGIVRKYTTLSSDYGNTMMCTINNSDITASDSILSSTGYSRFDGEYRITINSSTVRTRSLAREAVSAGSRSSPNISLKIDDCTITTTHELLRWHAATSVSYPHPNVYPTIITNSTISCTSLYYHYLGSSSASDNRYDTTFTVIGCNLTISGRAFDFAYTQYVYGIIFYNNNILLLGGDFIYSAYRFYGTSIINISEAVIGGHLFYGGGGIRAKLNNLVINGYLTTSVSGNGIIYANNCSATAVHGSDVHELVNCSIGPNNGGNSLSNLKASVFKNCNIDSSGIPMLVSKNSDVTMIDCTINADIENSEDESSITIFNSEVNNINTPFIAKELNVLKKISSIFRVGGSDGSLEISSKLSDFSSCIIDEVRGVPSVGSNTVSAYILYSGSFDLAKERISSTISYTDTSDFVNFFACEVTEDLSSSWDSVLPEYSKIKISADFKLLAEAVLEKGVVFTISAFFYENEAKHAWLDLDIDGTIEA